MGIGFLVNFSYWISPTKGPSSEAPRRTVVIEEKGFKQFRETEMRYCGWESGDLGGGSRRRALSDVGERV
jgi:hypothetical protein